MKFRLVLSLIVLAAVFPGPAFGQVEAVLGVLSIAPRAGTLASPESADAGRSVITLAAPVQSLADEEKFVSDIKTVARELGYQVAAVGTPGGKLSVLLTKQSTNIGAALFGKDWRIRANLSLQDDKRTVEITAGLAGNDPQASGTAQETVDKLKSGLEKVAAK